MTHTVAFEVIVGNPQAVVAVLPKTEVTYAVDGYLLTAFITGIDVAPLLNIARVIQQSLMFGDRAQLFVRRPATPVYERITIDGININFTSSAHGINADILRIRNKLNTPKG